MADETLYYIKKANDWLTYDEAHRYGCTKVKPVNIIFYTSSLNPVTVRKDVQTNTFYDLQEDQPHDWVNDIDELNLYSKIGNISLYKGKNKISGTGYSDSAFSNTPNFFKNEDFALSKISDLYNNFGITDHKCDVYYIYQGAVLSWYDKETSLYWDNRSFVKRWLSEPPKFQEAEETTYIAPSTSKMEMLPQWEYDLSQAPTHYRVSSFIAQDEALTSQEPLKHGLLLFDQFADIQNLVDFKFYTDITEFNVTFYVFPEEGIYDYEDVFHPQGDTFLGDYQYVWVDSDGEASLYLGESLHTYTISHDDYNDVVYWFESESKYYSYETAHALGYTYQPSEIIEIFDENLIDVTANVNVWENPQYFYFTPNGRSSAGIDVPPNTPMPLYYENGTQISYSDWRGTVLIEFVNEVYYSSGLIESSFGNTSTEGCSFSNVNGYLYFKHTRSNTWSPMIGMSIRWG